MLHTTPAGNPAYIEGEGPTIVLIHGVLMDHRMWRAQVKALSRSFRVVCMNMLGHGKAPNPPGPRKLDDFVEQTREVITDVCGHEHPALAGFSMGGLVVQAYAIKYSRELRGLMIMNAVYNRTPAEKDNVMVRLNNLVNGSIKGMEGPARERWFRDDEKQKYPREIDEMISWLYDGDPEAKTKAYRVFATSDDETSGRLGEIVCPTLVMTGDGDAGSPPHMSEAMAGEIPNARLNIFEHQQHMMLVLDAEHVSQVMREFLESL